MCKKKKNLDTLLFSNFPTANPFYHWKFGSFKRGWRLNHRNVTSYTQEHFYANGIIRCPSYPKEHIWLRIRLMFGWGHRVLWLTERVKPATFPAVILTAKSYPPNLLLPVRSITVNRSLMLMWCSCLLQIVSPGVTDWEIWRVAVA